MMLKHHLIWWIAMFPEYIFFPKSSQHRRTNSLGQQPFRLQVLKCFFRYIIGELYKIYAFFFAILSGYCFLRFLYINFSHRVFKYIVDHWSHFQVQHPFAGHDAPLDESRLSRGGGPGERRGHRRQIRGRWDADLQTPGTHQRSPSRLTCQPKLGSWVGLTTEAIGWGHGSSCDFPLGHKGDIKWVNWDTNMIETNNTIYRIQAG